MEEAVYYVGVDVGTSSVRAALVDSKGKMITSATQNISIWEPQDNYYEQSSYEIWDACCLCVKTVVAGVDKNKVKGIGFDATCSLVVLDTSYKPLSVSADGKTNFNVIMWMDHRAKEQADKINSTHHDVLRYVGGSVSLEMQTPKLLWLKENLKTECWDRAGVFFDLPDFLTWKSTGSETRSLCSLTCKWTYQPDDNGDCSWNSNFLTQINLGDLTENNFQKIGSGSLPPGVACGDGLTPEAAASMTLLAGTAVGTSMIDAHAGALGTLGCVARKQTEAFQLPDVPVNKRMALICGTSACHVTVSGEPVFVPGVWGPYCSAIIPGMWANEGGQSACGKLLDHIVLNHPAYSWVKADADHRNVHPFVILNEALEFITKRDKIPALSNLTSDMHVWPDYHGNRSPLADSSLKGMISGLSLAAGIEELAVLYLATIQALAYGTRHILDTMAMAGHTIELIVACGGLSKNPLFLQTHADATGMPVIVPDATESVLLGAAMMGASASGRVSSLQDAMKEMGGSGHVIMPSIGDKEYHQRKYKVFLKMVEDQKSYRAMMHP